MPKRLQSFFGPICLCMAASLFAVNRAHGQFFVGSVQPTVYCDANVFDGVQLASGVGADVAPGSFSRTLASRLGFGAACRRLLDVTNVAAGTNTCDPDASLAEHTGRGHQRGRHPGEHSSDDLRAGLDGDSATVRRRTPVG